MGSSDSHSNLSGTDAISGAVTRHVGVLKDAQAALEMALKLKRDALIDGDTNAMQRYAAEEDRLASEFARLERERSAILISAEKAGRRVNSLSELAVALGLPRSVREDIEHVKQSAEHLQRETWTQLIVASRASRHYDDLIALIASGGQQPESYSEHPEQDDDGGGNLLDAAA